VVGGFSLVGDGRLIRVREVPVTPGRALFDEASGLAERGEPLRADPVRFRRRADLAIAPHAEREAAIPVGGNRIFDPALVHRVEGAPDALEVEGQVEHASLVADDAAQHTVRHVRQALEARRRRVVVREHVDEVGALFEIPRIAHHVGGEIRGCPKGRVPAAVDRQGLSFRVYRADKH
jgi:hypothetical protein